MTPENIGNYQEKRAARRTERSKKMASKGKDTTKFDAKTAFIVEKAKKINQTLIARNSKIWQIVLRLVVLIKTVFAVK